MAARRAIYGPELYRRIAGESWTHWDLWFCLVCVSDFAGDWTALEEAVLGSPDSAFGQRDREAKDSHLHDLRARLRRSGIDADTVAAPQLGDKVVLGKARRKTLRQGLAGRDLTPAMEDTPRRRLRTRALRGHWGAFPRSPEPDCDLFGFVIEEARYARRGSFGIAMELEDIVRELDAARTQDPAGRLALWRGLVTACMEAFEEGLRDPDGAVATCAGDALAYYVALPWEAAGLGATDYYQDLCEVCVWDVWGLRYRRETAPFRKVRRRDVALVQEILGELEAEHRVDHLEYEAEQAGQLVAWLLVATRSFDGFVSTARRLGCDAWMPVSAMAEKAVAAGRPQLAVDVLAAATSRPGMHRDFLTRRLEEITGPPTRRSGPGPAH